MTDTLQIILEKVERVQLGLLRTLDENGDKTSWPTKACRHVDELSCVLTLEECPESLEDKTIVLVQKHKEDYLYLTGIVKTQVLRDKLTILSVDIVKACWFTRHIKSGISSLKEKHIYESYSQAS